MKEASIGNSAFVGTHASPARLLIIEDDAEQAVFLHTVLNGHNDPITRQKYEISITTNIENARYFLMRDLIDIYIVDLVVPISPAPSEAPENSTFGADFVAEIVNQSNAGVIVYSSIPPERESQRLLDMGADDYIWKYPPIAEETIPGIIRARVAALGRRVQLSRPKSSHLFAHTGRVFLVGNWKYIIGDRALQNGAGEIVHLSATEHALLRYACVAGGNEVDSDSFAHEALHKDSTAQFRLDNLVHRLKKKLGGSVEWDSLGNRSYKLITVRELKPIRE